jgi:Carboxypeptidase regulatory-like domain/TonB dependent receptor/TonB-dependent Receptor Plug Domain
VIPSSSQGARAARVAGAAVLLALAACPTEAQTTSGALVGRVRGTTGAPLKDAVVQARSAATGQVRAAVTDESGAYRIDLLAPGTWSVAARLADGAVSETRTVDLGLEQTLHVDFTVGTGLVEGVVVSAEPPLIDPKQVAGKLRVTSEQIDGLPLAGRSFTDLAFLDSSVTQAAPGTFYGERAATFTVHGQSGRANAFLVDGMDNNDDTSGTALNSAFSPQVIREFVLSTSQYAAEFGRASGGVLNIVTQQGTNVPAWDMFAQGSAASWNSSGEFVDGLPAQPAVEDTGRRWQAGFATGGPIRRDEAFYFAAIEHQASDDVVPFTGIDRQGIQGGRVLAPNRDDNLFVRTDFHLDPRTTLMVRVSGDDRTTNALNVGGMITPEGGFRIDERDIQLAAALTRISSADLLSETRLFAGTSDFDQQAESARPGVSRPSGVFGGNNLHRQERGEDKLQLVQNFTVRRERHTFKFGLDLARSRTSIHTAFNPNGNFIYNSDRSFEPGDCGIGADASDPFLPDGTVLDPNTGQPLCTGVPDFDDDGDGTVDEPTNVLSYPVVFTYIGQHPSAQLDDTRVGVFAQDTFEVGPRLLLDYGLRYDVSTYVLPESAAVPSVIPNGGAERDTNNVAPRFGFTYSPGASGRTVVRGGAGVFYDKLVLGFPAVAAITSGTEIGMLFPQGFKFELTEDVVESIGMDALLPELVFPDELTLRFSTDPQLDTPYTTLFNLGVERGLGPRDSMHANAMRSIGHHLPLMRDLNPVSGLVEPGDDCTPANVDPTLDVGLPCHLADPTVGSIAAITTDGRSWYWGVGLGWRRQTEESWFSADYTVSRAENMGFDPLKGGITLPPDSIGLTGERGRADGDRRHRLVLAGDVPLPWASLRLSGVFQVASGVPFDVTTGQDDNLDGILTDRPPGVSRNAGEDAPLDVVNDLREAYNVTVPADQRLDPVTSLHEPTFAQVDVRLSRRFRSAERSGHGEVFLQVFNLLDRVNGAMIEGRAISRQFGQVITLAGPPRTIELGAKIGF